MGVGLVDPLNNAFIKWCAHLHILVPYWLVSALTLPLAALALLLPFVGFTCVLFDDEIVLLHRPALEIWFVTWTAVSMRLLLSRTGCQLLRIGPDGGVNDRLHVRCSLGGLALHQIREIQRTTAHGGCSLLASQCLWQNLTCGGWLLSGLGSLGLLSIHLPNLIQ